MTSDPREAWGPDGLRRFLERLPHPVYRLDLEVPTPLATPLAQLKDVLLDGTGLTFCNDAFMALHPEGPEAGALHGSPLRHLLPGRFFTSIRDLAAFQGEGRLELGDLRAVIDDAPRFFRSMWTGDLADGLLHGIWGALIDETVEREVQQQAVAVIQEDDSGLIGQARGLRSVMDKVDQVAATDATVLITGETGTGKELVTRTIHQRSRRASRPLIAVNCGAIASTLVESELFGHEKGAFTGADSRKLGRFELADGGTLLLDEVGDLPADLQVRLLRVLQEGEFTRVGGTVTVRVDVRVIAATHRDLAAAVRNGDFRQDLYYRLNVFPIRVPPLRERLDDLPELVRHLVARYSAPMGRTIDTIPGEIFEVLADYPWPGNVRELANLIERSVIATNGTTLQLGDWATGQYRPVAQPASTGGGAQTLEEFERDHILKALVAAGWRVSGSGGAAESLGLKPTTLEARMKKLRIERPGRSG